MTFAFMSPLLLIWSNSAVKAWTPASTLLQSADRPGTLDRLDGPDFVIVPCVEVPGEVGGTGVPLVDGSVRPVALEVDEEPPDSVEPVGELALLPVEVAGLDAAVAWAAAFT